MRIIRSKAVKRCKNPLCRKPLRYPTRKFVNGRKVSGFCTSCYLSSMERRKSSSVIKGSNISCRRPV